MNLRDKALPTDLPVSSRGNVVFHNTTESTQPELGRYREKAQSQEELILDNMRGIGWGLWSPSLVWEVMFNYNVPITSVRRALTNLTDSGDLVKTEKQVKGPYGRPEFQWRLADKYRQREMF